VTVLFAAVYMLGVCTPLFLSALLQMRAATASAAAGPAARLPTPEGPRPLIPVARLHRDLRADITQAQRRDRWRAKGTP